MQRFYLFHGLMMFESKQQSHRRLKAGHMAAAIVLFTVFVYIVEALTLRDLPSDETGCSLTELKPETFSDNITIRTCFILFYQEGSVFCDRMEHLLVRLSDRQDEDISFYKLNVEEYPEYINSYRISGTPSILIFKDGKEAKRIMGIISDKNLKTIYNNLNK